jgi:hypothetical protein
MSFFKRKAGIKHGTLIVYLLTSIAIAILSLHTAIAEEGVCVATDTVGEFRKLWVRGD